MFLIKNMNSNSIGELEVNYYLQFPNQFLKRRKALKNLCLSKKTQAISFLTNKAVNILYIHTFNPRYNSKTKKMRKVIIEDINDEVTVRCPYMPQHIMHVDSLLTHLIRCPAQNKHEFKQCAYNSMHVVKNNQIHQHYKSNFEAYTECEDYFRFMDKRAKKGFDDDDDWGTPEDPDLIVYDYSSYIRQINKPAQPETYVGERHNTDIFLKWKAQVQKKYKPFQQRPPQKKKTIEKYEKNIKNKKILEHSSKEQQQQKQKKKEKSQINPVAECITQLEQSSMISSFQSDSSYVLGNKKNLSNAFSNEPSLSNQQSVISFFNQEKSYIFEDDNNVFIRNPKRVSRLDVRAEDSFLSDSLDELWQSGSALDKSMSECWEKGEGVDALGELLETQVNFLQEERIQEKSELFKKRPKN